MSRGAFFTEKCQVSAGFMPVDLQTAANTGDWFNMQNYQKCAIIFFTDAGTAGDDPTITVNQATDNAGTGSKGLNFTRVDTKQGADLFAVAQFTEQTQTAASTYTDATSAELEKIWIVDIDADQLDADNDFDHIQLTVADVGGNAQLGCALYIGHEPRVEQNPLPSSL